MLHLSETLRDTTPPCAGRWDLFDSTDRRVHEEAADLCATCPMQLECWDILQATQEASHVGGRPSGTWAGQLIGGDTRAQQFAEEDARFSVEEANAAHGRYQKGDRDDETKTGARVYERRRAKAARIRKNAA